MTFLPESYDVKLFCYKGTEKVKTLILFRKFCSSPLFLWCFWLIWRRAWEEEKRSGCLGGRIKKETPGSLCLLAFGFWLGCGLAGISDENFGDLPKIRDISDSVSTLQPLPLRPILRRRLEKPLRETQASPSLAFIRLSPLLSLASPTASAFLSSAHPKCNPTHRQPPTQIFEEKASKLISSQIKHTLARLLLPLRAIFEHSHPKSILFN